MKFEALTIKDIAKALGLSTSTVSRALRDSYEISAETKKTVREYAEQNNYNPNPIALSLKERKSRTIGVMVSEIANNFFSQIINGIESVAGQRGYNIIIAQSRESEERENTSLQFLTSRSVDGLIVSVSTETKDISYYKQLQQRGMPIVFFDRVLDEINTHKVIVDNYKGAYDAAVHLVQCGYKNIATLCNAPGLSITKERLAGYKAALADNNLPVKEEMIKFCMHGGMIAEEVEQAVEGLLNNTDTPDAILASADKLTINCLRILSNKGLSVPGDIGLIGFSNTDLGEFFAPPLSVIRQPAFEMGETAMSLLLNMVESKRPVTDFETKVLSTELIIRESARMRKDRKIETA
jgi:DNA-binding LacI/PurR family transcriptional regulator